jgi:hypothetical protein
LASLIVFGGRFSERGPATVLVWVADLDHGFGGIKGWNFNPKNKPNPDHVRYTKMLTTAYWDAYLKADEKARAYLNSDQLPAQSKGTVRIDRK